MVYVNPFHRSKRMNMNLEIRHLRLIRTISEEGNLTKAGERLHLTQSALSHQLRFIEESTGVKIFHRMKKVMVLTPAGERLLRSAELVLNEMARADEEFKLLREGESGTIRISTECFTCYYWLPMAIQRFSAKFPKVEVRIVTDFTRYPIKGILAGQLDLGVVCNVVDEPALRYEPIFRDELVVVTAPEHHLARQRFLQPQDFAQEKLILYSHQKEDTERFEAKLAAQGIFPKELMGMPLTDAIVEMVKANFGISLLAKWAVKSHLNNKTLRAVRLTEKGVFRQWQAVTLNHERTPSYVNEFIKLLSESLKGSGANPNAG
jgi:LysR family transcriptional regulator for metE and metH